MKPVGLVVSCAACTTLGQDDGNEGLAIDECLEHLWRLTSAACWSYRLTGCARNDLRLDANEIASVPCPEMSEPPQRQVVDGSFEIFDGTSLGFAAALNERASAAVFAGIASSIEPVTQRMAQQLGSPSPRRSDRTSCDAVPLPQDSTHR